MWCCFHPKKTHTIRTGGRRYEASKFTTPKSKKYCYKWIQIQWKLIWVLLSCLHNITLVAAAGWAANANSRTEKYCWKMWQILAKIQAVPNFQIGGARQAAVAPQPMHVWKFCQLKNCSPYTDDSKKYTCSRVRAILKALEAGKVKLSCFKGIVNPTDIHGSWGTWPSFMSKRCYVATTIFQSSTTISWWWVATG